MTNGPNTNEQRQSLAMPDAPPPGVLAGESVPRQNTRNARTEAAIDRMANRMKQMPGYRHLSEQERREKARAKLRVMGVL